MFANLQLSICYMPASTPMLCTDTATRLFLSNLVYIMDGIYNNYTYFSPSANGPSLRETT